MARRHGVQAEVLLSLAVIMFTATALLGVIFLETHYTRIDALHGLLGRGFASTSAAPGFAVHGLRGGLAWRVDGSQRITPLGPGDTDLDAETHALGMRALEQDSPHVQSGAPWEPIRFAAPVRDGAGAIAGRIDAPVSGAVLGGLVVVDVVVFGLFGFTLLRRRVVGPLRRLAAAVREVGDGELSARVPVEGAGEIAELGATFNEMQAALAARTGALEKAVEELRETNARLVQAREGLDRAERLAVVGSLAAGVAHEVGNPMGALLAFLDVAGRDPALSGESRRCLERASEQGERVRIILRQLLDFSRPPQLQRTAVPMEEIARQVVELVSAQREFSDIDFEIVAAPTLPPARGDRSVASQILLNLVLNAAAALEAAETRRIRLSLSPIATRTRARDGAAAPAPPRPPDGLECRVEDSGPGVRLENPERVFDPFFTTKDPGRGTGLGLANARRLAEEMDGRVELDPERSALGGACFRFVLMLETGSEAAAAPTRVRGEDEPQSRMP